MALDVGYFRRAWAHFRVTDNLLVRPEDFTRFDIVAPADPRLPGGGGYTIHGFYDVVPAQVRPGAQPQRAVGRLRRAVRELERRGRHGEQPAEERRHAAGAASAPARRWRTTATSSTKLPEMNNFRLRVGHADAAGLVARRRVVPPRVAVPDAVQGVRRLHRAEDRGAGGGLVPQPARPDRTAGAAAEQRRAGRRSPPPTRSWPPTPRWAGRWRETRRT